MIETNFTIQGSLLGLSSEITKLTGKEITLDDDSKREYKDGTTFLAVDTRALYILYKNKWYEL